MADDRPATRWQELTGGTSGRDYAARFDAFAASGADVHGEASFCAALLPPGARVLDAGCGTGRVAIRLAAQGFDVVGLDVDDSMLAVARDHDPALTWVLGDLADLPSELVAGPPYDLVLLAGNVVPLLAPGTLGSTVAALSRLVRDGGALVAGFGLDRTHLPRGCPVTTLEEYDAALASRDLHVVDRFSTWDAAAYAPEAGYVVSVARAGPSICA
jgi:2-polyprenyl-3-methyl-5-hydroxy-6-metoxy-1,4-benzoquinol methylase